MITFGTEHHTAVDTGASTLIVQAARDHAVVRSLVEAVSPPDGVFRRLAQIVVENGFDVPAFICVRREESELHLFLVGEVTARITGPEEMMLDGAGTSTWTEHVVPIDADVSIEWTSSDVPAADTREADSESSPEPPETPPTPTLVAAAPPPPIPPTDPPHVVPQPEPPIVSVPAAVPIPPAMPDPNLLGTDMIGIDVVDPTEPPPFSPESTTEADPPEDVQPSEASVDPDLTLDADEVRRSLPADSPVDPATNSPLVTARVCPCGAPSPLNAEFCSACGSSLRREGVTIEQVPRPLLGYLVLDDGSRLPLADTFVIGRNVPEDYEVAGRQYPGTSVESPTKQVSKVHLEVRLVDWTVNVVDLDSANGTYIEDADGHSPKRLRPNVVEQVTPGDSVHFGDRSFIFEAMAGS